MTSCALASRAGARIPPNMTLATLFNLAGPDLILILFIVTLLFGAKRLPELASSMGKAVREFTKAKDDSE